MMVRIYMILVLVVSMSSANVLSTFPKIVKWVVKTDKKPLNYALRNKVHPKTGVKFNKNGYPVFKKVDTCDMGLSWSQRVWDSWTSDASAVRQKHFAICSKKLYEKLSRNQLLKMKFTENQVSQLKRGKTPDGYTWHHSEKLNTLELVERKVHNQTAHSGGFSLYH